MNRETVLITGAGRGIGLEFVRQYAAAGAQVVACCRDPGRAADLGRIADATDGVEVHRLDVTEGGSVAALAEALSGRAIDILINNAGIMGGRPQDFGALDYEAWRRVMETNLLAPVRVAEAFVEHVARSRGSRIANLGSLLGSIAEASGNLVIYRTSKAALNMAVKCMATSLADRGILVVSLHPGHVRTDMGGAAAPIAPEDSVRGMRSVIAGLDASGSGGFFDFRGKAIPW